MKNSTINLCFLFLGMGLFWSCGSGEDQTSEQVSYLKSEFAPATYAALLDSAKQTGEVTEQEKSSTLAFIRANARRVPAGLSLSDLKNAAEGKAKMEKDAIELSIDKINLTTDRKIYGFHMHLTAFNQGEATLTRFRGVVDWLDAEGNLLKTSPRFSIKGPVEPGDSVDKILLQTAYYRPTGNELNNPRLNAWRDTLELMIKSAGHHNPDQFRFRLLDLELANGMNVDQYWLQTAEARAASAKESAAQSSPLPLLKWAGKNEDWINKLKAGLGEHYLEITPILTNKGELTHGQYLVFDRISKVRSFFVKQQKVPGRRINPGRNNGLLVLNEEVDFWKWPMELRIFEADVD